MKLYIIIPAYNEEKRIGKTLEEFITFFKKSNNNFEIITVLNNCKDNTLGVVENKKKVLGHIKILNFSRGGKGFAIKEGFKEAFKFSKDGDLIGFVDADMATSPKSFSDLIFDHKNYDGAIACRHCKNSKSNTSKKRKITSLGFNFITRGILIIPYKDTQCGAKLFTKHAVDEILRNPPIAQWAFDAEILYNLYRKGYRIKQVPTVWEDKTGGSVNLLKTPIQMFFSIIRLRLNNSILKGIVRLYDKLPEKVKIHHLI
ncbi:hypothetical protein COU57_06055 [Candidatus Pacearchaeota archaeon CG10_big_fil_rev_8_21_14_0_10_32_14]|nr:MAG: hypothetical protein COU57_06055 [Candidatus Pacearchaeota archaeon CG10_big_fil_rev_8_21_14_0_10_32_14]